GALRLVIGPFDVKMDEAFAPSVGGVFEADKPAGGVARDQEYRMNEQTDFEAAVVEFANNGIDQKGHIVIDDFEHGNTASLGQRPEPNLPGLRAPFGKESPRSPGEACRFRRTAILQILRSRGSEQFGDEAPRYARFPACHEGTSRLDQR